MHVLHIVRPIRPAGCSAVPVENLILWLRSAGVDGEIASLYFGGELAGKIVPVGASEIRVTRGQCWFGARNERLDRLTVAADVVHLHGVTDVQCWPAIASARNCNKPVICSPYGAFVPRFLRHPRSIGEVASRSRALRSMRGLSGFCFLSQTELDLSKAAAATSVPRFVYPLVLCPQFYGKLPSLELAESLATGIRKDGPWILAIATPEMTTLAYGVLVGAFECVLSRVPRAQLIFVGMGGLRFAQKIRNLARSTKDAENVHFFGELAGAALVSLYRRADVLIAIGAAEGIDRTALEVIACETPVILTTDVAVHKEIIAAGAGRAAESTAWSIGSSLVQILADESRRRRMGVNGRRWVLESLAPGPTAAKLRDYYSRISESKLAAMGGTGLP